MDDHRRPASASASLRDDPAYRAALRRVGKTFSGYRRAMLHLYRCRRPSSMAVARLDAQTAEITYLACVVELDKIVETRRHTGAVLYRGGGAR